MTSPVYSSKSTKYKALVDDIQRKRGVRDTKKRTLIVCEDNKSAPNYFYALKKHENLSATSVTIVGSGGNTQPIQVVNKAIHMRDQAARPDSETEEFESVWCVIDGDFETAIPNARARAIANGVHIAVSTACFEYWILLHFVDDAKPRSSSELVKELKTSHCKSYDKGKTNFSGIVEHARTASDRAKNHRQKSVRPENQNPCSDLYMLIQELIT